MRFKQLLDGDWVFPVRRGYYIQCCDCGLVHRINFALIKQGRGNQIAFQAFRVKSRRKVKAAGK